MTTTKSEPEVPGRFNVNPLERNEAAPINPPIMAEHGPRSLTDVLKAMPCPDEIDFEVSPVAIQLQELDLDSEL